MLARVRRWAGGMRVGGRALVDIKAGFKLSMESVARFHAFGIELAGKMARCTMIQKVPHHAYF
ncbi:hypothetical protein VL04_20910 [Chromobacterium violaceum]|nr:hypothetical protein VK93_21550 [Chromobacterium violaceum]KMN85974.1 hypothetical protein VL02_11475 [Chromobacterium violaceum]KMN88357.1 hypothetical protein VL04_20910 [Chromobacterium violaceum]KMO02856.1 hypothetical protein VL16_16585 [Chromobacterium violaceum]